jgi:YesN/AraC family two-component response regulator
VPRLIALLGTWAYSFNMSPSSTVSVNAGDVAAAPETARTFLIVDDSAVIRRRLVSLLAEVEGVTLVGEASNGVEGGNLIRELSPDVVILDIRMPERSGIGLLESIKDDADLPVVIILTNYPYSAYRKRCFELGATHFFDKTTEFDRLENAVRDLATVSN